MRDIGERSAVDKRRGVFQCLYQIRFQRVFEDCCHRALDLEVRDRYRLILIGVADDDGRDFLLQIRNIFGEAEDRHDLAGNRDLESVFARYALHAAAQSVDDIPQLTIIHIDYALPCDLFDIDAEAVALLDMVVKTSRDQIVGDADGVHIAGKVEIDVFHRYDLRVAAAGRAAFDAEDRSQRRFPQSGKNIFAHFVQGVRKTDSRRRLTLSCRSRGDRGHQHQFAVRCVCLVF